MAQEDLIEMCFRFNMEGVKFTDELMMRSLNLGDVEVIHINGGYFRLDGGTMFGVVPKTMWDKQIACDSRNRIISLQLFARAHTRRFSSG